MQAVILAAGKGLRLRPFTENSPKPLIPIAGRPLIKYTLQSLPDEITEIIIVIGYLGEQIKSHLGNSWQGKVITYVEQTELLGTGDALFRAKDLLQGKFLALNGDDLYKKSDLEKLLQFNYSVLAWPSQTAYQYGLKTSPDGYLQGFDKNSGLTNCGAYCLNKDFFSYQLESIEVHSTTEYSLPHTLIKVAEQEQVKVIEATDWLPVGTPEQLKFAERYYLKKIKN